MWSVPVAFVANAGVIEMLASTHDLVASSVPPGPWPVAVVESASRSIVVPPAKWTVT